ncbi:SMP-30/gluconolactonase/LRE family protein [Jiulongibacter sediminis]|uniref:SMP-30/gluconolactonase/LRE family protein n=1 Tax=Jiulongibacter sediminis TaxID=1605367 RepID=UPI0026F1C9BE|nr:SMP-30/gluconolactonase/LRE family protein [Jiulongibacter sediminis]
MKKIVNGLFTLLILLFLCVGFILKESGVFRKIAPHFDGTAEEINSPAGIEDLTIDHSNGDIYFAGTDRRHSEKTGAIYKANSHQKDFNLIDISKDFPDTEFRPHGISLLKKDGKTYLFVVNHRNKEHVITRLDYVNDSLTGFREFRDPLMISPNDILAIDTATFYFSNDHSLPKGTERTIKDFLLDKNGFLVLYHQDKAKKVTQNMAYANGINISPDGQYVYVSATTEKKVFVYQKDPQNHTLKLIDDHNTGTGVDNIEIDQYGNLIVGAHPKMLKFLGHAQQPENRSPSQILKIVYLPETDYKFLQEELYLNNGDPLSGSSVGAYFEKKDGSNDLFIGSVFESKILRLHRNL